MKNTLILGDCASTGSLTYVKEIIGQNQISTGYTLSSDSKHHKKIIHWYLKMVKGKRGNIIAGDLFKKALQYMEEKELNEAWPKYLDSDLNVTNMSKLGATAYGYYKRLLKYELRNGRPDLIVLTDYDPTHPWQRINLDRNKYFLEKNYDSNKPYFSVNPELKSPAEVQRLAFNKAEYTYNNNLNQTRNFKIMKWFLKYLDKEKYNVIKLKLYGGFDQFDRDTNVIDCSNLHYTYSLLPQGVDGVLKKEVQSQIGGRVQEKILQLTNKIFRV